MEKMTKEKGVVGYFWVVEWTELHRYHAHVVFWLDRQKNTALLSLCTYSKYNLGGNNATGLAYRTDVNIGRSILEISIYLFGITIRKALTISVMFLSYLAKEEQKDGLCAYGCNDVPPRPASGRPRKSGP